MLDLDTVEFAAGLLDDRLGGALVNDEHKRVVVFNGLDHALAGQWVLHNGVLVPSRLGGDTVRLDLRVASERLGPWESECDFVPDL